MTLPSNTNVGASEREREEELRKQRKNSKEECLESNVATVAGKSIDFRIFEIQLLPFTKDLHSRKTEGQSYKAK